MFNLSLLFVVAGSLPGLIENATSAETLTAKTNMTVVYIDNFINESSQSPSEMLNYKETVLLSDVVYKPYAITWTRDPKCPWNPVSTGASTRMWKIYTSNSGKTYNAIGWDYLYPCADSHMRERGDIPTTSRGTMFTTLCDTNPARCNGRERTNIMFWYP